MEIGEAVGRYEQAAALLPSRWQQAARRVPEHRKAQAEEFRLRAGRPMTLLTCEGELLVSDELPRQSVTQADLEQLCDAVTGYSRYAAAETMGKGYLIGRGGFRIGLCGTVAVRGDGGTALRDISSAVVRISRQVRGLQPWPVASTLYRGQPMKITRAKPCEGVPAPAGTLLPGKRMIVSCGKNTALELLEVQLQGGKRLTQAQFLCGHPVTEPVMLGS